MCGVPIVLSASMYHGFDFLLAHRGSPERSRSEALLQQLRPATDPSPSLRVAVARSPDELAAAQDLVRRRYARRGYASPATDANGDRERARSLQEITFLVSSNRAAVGTLTLGLDGPCGLLAEGGYGDVIDKFRAAGDRVCELTRLAVTESADSKTVLAALFSLAHAVGRTTHDVTRVFIEVNPRHVAFHCKMLGFGVAGGERFCERVRARSVLLELESGMLEARLRALEAAVSKRPLAKAA